MTSPCSSLLIKLALHVSVMAIAASAWAQDVPTISANVNLVTLLATVHDHDGRIVSNLGPDDFVLEEDGIPQKIRYFSRESDLPLTIGILVDTSRSQREYSNRRAGPAILFSSRSCVREKTRHSLRTSTHASRSCKV